MLFRIIYFFCIMIFITGCASNSRSEMPPAERLAQMQTNVPQGLDIITITSMRERVKRGEYGNLTIKGQPNTKYTITATYKSGSNVFTAFKPKVTGTDGIANWSWLVDKDTALGTYGIVIKGNGHEVNTSYTVTD